jgi:cell division protein FtsB
MRILILALAAMLVLIQARLWLSDGGLREVWRLNAEVARRAEENGRLAARNAALAAEVLDLKQGVAAAEERARTELGMIQSGETFYQIAPAAPEPRSPPP